MVYRVSWLAGIAGIAFALARAERLLQSSASGLPWELILAAAVVLGGTLTWAGVAYRMRSGWLAVFNVAAMVITIIRIAVPDTTWLIFPTSRSLAALSTEMAFTRDVIRTGVAPVVAVAGIIAILAAVFWGMGALLTWGLLTGRPYVAVLTPMVVYLEFAVMDRRPSGAWTTVFMVMLGLALLSVALDRRRDGTGVLVSRTTRLALVRSIPSAGIVALVVAMTLAVGASAAMATLVPRNGYLDWRSHSGLRGDYYGSISYNPFVGIHQGLLSQTNVPVFAARVTGDIPGDQIYWRMVTLDSYDGGQWYIEDNQRVEGLGDVDHLERDEIAFRGPTASVTADVTVLGLQMEWLPATYAPVSFSADNDAVERSVRVRVEDGSLRFDPRTYRGMTYTVVSAVPAPDLDALARRDDGTPSIVFEDAIAGGDFSIDPSGEAPRRRPLPDAEHYLELPTDLDPGIRALARRETAGLQTDFERGLALESFFRISGAFTYSTSIEPGHGATDLADWLLDPNSANYRTGYCEQYATSMAVMARAIGIPSRVVLGFAPGTNYDEGIVVRDRNAHAWVELWMPTQGWVRFDPTPRGDNPSTATALPFALDEYLDVVPPVIDPGEIDVPTTTLGTDESTTVPTGQSTEPGQKGSGRALPGWLPAVMLIAVLAFGAVPAAKALRRRRRLRRLAAGDVAAGWAELVDRLADLGEAPAPSATPTEIAAAVDPAMGPLADVYGEAVYGEVAMPDQKRMAVAIEAFENTEAAMSVRYSRGLRIVSWYRLASLWPARRATPRRA